MPTKALARLRARRESRACFCTTRFAARTARNIGPGRSSRTGASRAGAWFNGRCSISARSTTASGRPGAARSRSFDDAGQSAQIAELGLDQFEGRSWRGLHRHALMAMIAYAFLQHLRLAAASGKKESRPAPLNRRCRRYEKQSSSPWPALRPTDAHTAAGKSADRSIESAKVVLAWPDHRRASRGNQRGTGASSRNRPARRSSSQNSLGIRWAAQATVCWICSRVRAPGMCEATAGWASTN